MADLETTTNAEAQNKITSSKRNWGKIALVVGPVISFEILYNIQQIFSPQKPFDEKDYIFYSAMVLGTLLPWYLIGRSFGRDLAQSSK